MASPSSELWSDVSDEAPAQEILERIDSLWTSVGPSLESLKTEALNAPVDGQEWCPRELMAHLAHWNEAHWFAVSEHLAERSANIYEGWRAKNEQWFGEDAAVAAGDAFARLRSSHLRLCDLLHKLPSDQWGRPDPSLCTPVPDSALPSPSRSPRPLTHELRPLDAPQT